uniref:Uncharacterized protein n=2 Tax=Meloidogyne TaxID=189290 RepID=A0A6V7VUI5_MELEN|nr:unnamed protein product [Meloidogyne enterolobii]
MKKGARNELPGKWLRGRNSKSIVNFRKSEFRLTDFWQNRKNIFFLILDGSLKSLLLIAAFFCLISTTNSVDRKKYMQ